MSELLARRMQRLESSSAGPRLSDDNIDANVIVCSPASPDVPRGPACGAASEAPRLHIITEEVQPLDAQLDQDRLLKLFQTDLGFDGELPVSACVIYRALVHWRSFETESTDVFDKIMGIMRAAIWAQDPDVAPGAGASADSAAQPEAARSGAGQDEDVVGSIDKLAYWLANSACLLNLLLRSFKASEVPRETAAFRQAIFSPTVTSEDEIAAAEADGVQLVKPMFPALLFGQQLAAYVEEVYLCIVGNLNNDASTNFLRNTYQWNMRAAAQRLATPIPAAEARWSLITTKLSDMLNILKLNHVPAFLVRRVFRQIFALINAELFNRVLLNRRSCAFHFHIRQAVEFVAFPERSDMCLEDLRCFPALSMMQLHRIAGLNSTFLTHAMLDALREKSKEEASCDCTTSFLLDHDRSIPFSVSDMYKEQPKISGNDLLPPDSFLKSLLSP
ncbi:unnamed protein product [Closterium sp. NIES-53]